VTPEKFSPGRQFTGKNPPRPAAGGETFWGGAILKWEDFMGPAIF